MRKHIYEIIEVAEENDISSSIYDSIMLIAITVSLVPLAFKETTHLFTMIDRVTVSIFIIDYFLRWITSDYKQNTSNVIAFVKYPFTFMAIIDLLSILPSITLLDGTFRVFRMLKVMRLMRTFRVFRIFKAARYSKSVAIIINVFKNSKDALVAVGTLSFLYIIISTLVVFNVEPDTFESFFDAIYWATISLTTVGYGDVFCVTAIGKIVTMLSSVFGIAIVALPAGIVTAGYLDELSKVKKEKHNNELGGR